MSAPSKVKIVEVGPRDGLQNESQIVTATDKVELIKQLTTAGLQYIEVGSFVHPKKIPQMANCDEMFDLLGKIKYSGVTYAALTPNMKGYQRALAAGADEVAIFSAASESFSQKNTNCSIAETFDRFTPLVEAAKNDGIKVRGYISCVVACPYEGEISTDKVVDVADRLFQMGCYEISLGDTIGKATAAPFCEMISRVSQRVAIKHLAVHCHDTYGQALTNIYAALQLGIATVDSSVAGLGGCPFAPGASGNVATEDVVYLLNGLDIDTGIDLAALIQAGNYISDILGKANGSKVALAAPQPSAPGN